MLAHQASYALLRRADTGKTQFGPHLAIAFAVKGSFFIDGSRSHS